MQVEVPVAWGDMDVLGHVNNVVYLRWFETARIAHFTELLGSPAVPTSGIGPILAHQTIDYRIQLKYPDTVRVETTISKIGTTSFTMGFRIKSRAKAWAIAAEGEGVLVLYDYASGQKVVIDEAVRHAVYALEASRGA
jgi:acyl-CoA thioester hydrolase